MNLGKVMILGAEGMVGTSIKRVLETCPGVDEIIEVSRKTLDLRVQSDTFEYIRQKRPTWMILAAAKVGGILANSEKPAEFIYDNLAIQSNVIHGAHLAGVEKLVFLGSSCIYPRMAQQPIREDSLLTGELEATNESYAIAKIAGLKMCLAYSRQFNRDYRALMPTNLYGPGDRYVEHESHVIPGLVNRFHDAKIRGEQSVNVWGTGQSLREFLYVDDLATAVLKVMTVPVNDFAKISVTERSNHVNIGSGVEIKIAELAEMVKQVVGFEGSIAFDGRALDGTPRKLIDSSSIAKLGWKPRVSLEEGLNLTYQDFLKSLG